jgi:hypothetical protein
VKFVEVLCEGEADVPVLREVLTRRFGLAEDDEFRIHPHQGKGKLPPLDRLLAEPNSAQNQLLTQLPIKLSNYGKQATSQFQIVVVVLVDADDDDCRALKRSLLAVYDSLKYRPTHCLFRIAVEETESWFLADAQAVKRAYSSVDLDVLDRHGPDTVCGAWECLSEALGYERAVGQGLKTRWAEEIAPHLNLAAPLSPSLRAFIEGVHRVIGGPP